MRRFATLDCLVDSNDITTFSYNNVQSLRQALLSHVTYQPRIQQALQHTNFHFHRTCSYGNILRECHVGEGRTLLMFWRPAHSESGVTVSMSASSCSSIIPNPHADRELRSSAQQTDITCRYIAGMGTPGFAVSAQRSEQRSRQPSFREYLPHLLRRGISGAPGAPVRLPRHHRRRAPLLSRALAAAGGHQLLRALPAPLRGHQESQMVLDAFSNRMGAIGARPGAGSRRVARDRARRRQRARHGARAARGRPRAASGREGRRPCCSGCQPVLIATHRYHWRPKRSPNNVDPAQDPGASDVVANLAGQHAPRASVAGRRRARGHADRRRREAARAHRRSADD
ncbi:uncharacterized protein LOC134746306 isoform X3 [Cydia strobilella]|uniref:uncharacterized protein LOC134746306 isoform X3 n=1 Tax=Cydia strobilella TaxID=1100964 RepID=UPI00300549F1